jgi:hypothetical protein
MGAGYRGRYAFGIDHRDPSQSPRAATDFCRPVDDLQRRLPFNSLEEAGESVLLDCVSGFGRFSGAVEDCLRFRSA